MKLFLASILILPILSVYGQSRNDVYDSWDNKLNQKYVNWLTENDKKRTTSWSDEEWFEKWTGDDRKSGWTDPEVAEKRSSWASPMAKYVKWAELKDKYDSWARQDPKTGWTDPEDQKYTKWIDQDKFNTWVDQENKQSLWDVLEDQKHTRWAGQDKMSSWTDQGDKQTSWTDPEDQKYTKWTDQDKTNTWADQGDKRTSWTGPEDKFRTWSGNGQGKRTGWTPKYSKWSADHQKAKMTSWPTEGWEDLKSWAEEPKSRAGWVDQEKRANWMQEPETKEKFATWMQMKDRFDGWEDQTQKAGWTDSWVDQKTGKWVDSDDGAGSWAGDRDETYDQWIKSGNDDVREGWLGQDVDSTRRSSWTGPFRRCNQCNQCRRKVERVTDLVSQKACRENDMKNGHQMQATCCKAGGFVGTVAGKSYDQVCIPALVKFQDKVQTNCNLNQKPGCRRSFLLCCKQASDMAKKSQMMKGNRIEEGPWMW